MHKGMVGQATVPLSCWRGTQYAIDLSYKAEQACALITEVAGRSERRAGETNEA